MAQYLVIVVALTILGITDVLSMGTDFKSCETPAPENALGWCIPVAACKIIKNVLEMDMSYVPEHFQKYVNASKCSEEPELRYCCILRHIEQNFKREHNLMDPNLSQKIDNFTPKQPLDRAQVIPAVTPSQFIDIPTHPNLKFLPKICGDGIAEDRVSNGEIADLDEFPFMALLNYRTENGYAFGCGGTLINQNYVLTAAHCIVFSSSMKLDNVRLGEYDLEKEQDCITEDDGELYCHHPPQDIQIESVVVHQRYQPRSGQNDIALLRLARPANVSANNVRFICLPTTEELMTPEGDRALIAGWGATEKSKNSNVLMKGNVNLNVERSKCITSYATEYSVNINDAHICATGDEIVDTCKGDSGGPLFTKLKATGDLVKKYVQLGIVSFGPRIKCGEVNQHGGGVYMNVVKYMKWILDNLKS